MSVLVLESVNGSPEVQYRDIDGHPVPYMVTIRRRQLTCRGEEYLDGASQWQTVSMGDVLDRLRLGGSIADWLRSETRVDCSASRLLEYSNTSAPAYLWNVNA